MGNPKTGKPYTIYLVGKTRSYFKSGVLEFLESHRSSGLDKYAVEIQKIARGFITRNRVHGSHNARKNGIFILQKWWRDMLAKLRALKEVEKMREQRKRLESKRKQEAEEREWKERLETEMRESEESAEKEYRKYESRLDELKEQLVKPRNATTNFARNSTTVLNRRKKKEKILRPNLKMKSCLPLQSPLSKLLHRRLSLRRVRS